MGRVSPGLVIPHSHVNSVEPDSKELDVGLTEDACILGSNFMFVKNFLITLVPIQRRQYKSSYDSISFGPEDLHNLWQHRGADTRGSASRC